MDQLIDHKEIACATLAVPMWINQKWACTNRIKMSFGHFSLLSLIMPWWYVQRAWQPIDFIYSKTEISSSSHSICPESSRWQSITVCITNVDGNVRPFYQAEILDCLVTCSAKCKFSFVRFMCLYNICIHKIIRSLCFSQSFSLKGNNNHSIIEIELQFWNWNKIRGKNR